MSNQNLQSATLSDRGTETGGSHAPFLIVGVGASAGGLHAFVTLFEALPAEPHMAFVLVQHLDPHHESELAEILQTHTQLPVAQATDGETVRVNTVTVIPPGQSLVIERGRLHLSTPLEPHGQRTPIDLFFRSLAEDQGENAVCLILSGTGSDGTLGLKRIKERGGVVLVQAPDSAQYEGMPRSALSTGLVDWVAPVDELAQKLVEYQQSATRIQVFQPDETLAAAEADTLQRIFTQLQSQTGVDFSPYKRSTVLRRLQRRMQVKQTETLSAYLARLRTQPDETQALFKDLLISVTNFFRDEEAWQLLAQDVLPTLFAETTDQDTIRVWVPGCATGEEAYSLAILLQEEAHRQQVRPNFQIFATDLNEEALAFARRGLYPADITVDVSAARLERFFTREGDGYQIRSQLQESVLFAPHNLIKDAPFAQLDLISCRNLVFGK